MPIISATQEKKEKEAEERSAKVLIELDKERKANAKKAAYFTVFGFAVSLSLYLFLGPLPGIFSAVAASSIPSLVNLIDD